MSVISKENLPSGVAVRLSSKRQCERNERRSFDLGMKNRKLAEELVWIAGQAVMSGAVETELWQCVERLKDGSVKEVLLRAEDGDALRSALVRLAEERTGCSVEDWNAGLEQSQMIIAIQLAGVMLQFALDNDCELSGGQMVDLKADLRSQIGMAQKLVGRINGRQMSLN